jgi:hypothetical protein
MLPMLCMLLLCCSLVVTAAGLLGVSVNDALEAYGLYFVQHVEDQVSSISSISSSSCRVEGFSS